VRLRSLRSVVGFVCVLSGATVSLALPIADMVQTRGTSRVALEVSLALLGVPLAFALRWLCLRLLGRVLTEQKAESLRFHTAINNMSQGLCFFDGQQRLIVCNDRYADLYKLSPEVVRPGMTLAEIVDHRYKAGTVPDMTSAEYLEWRNSIAHADEASETITVLKDGRTLSIHHEPMPDGGWVATHEDISEQRRAQAEIERLARHDALTGLPNRLLFRERLEHAVQCIQAGEIVAVLCIDLDRFKAVNDRLGHVIGDQLLRAATHRLCECVRQGDLVVRLGGDEFAVIQADAAQPGATHALAKRLVSVIAAPFDIDGQQVVVGSSIGVALIPGDGSNPDELLRKADLALYDAKSRGRGTYSFFELRMDELAQGRRAMESDLRRAAADGALELHYQPIVGLRDNKVVAFEALLRWHHPTRGMVMPDSFIPLAEKTGYIDELGGWVFQEAFAEATRWPEHVSVAVNLSPVQLKSGNLVRTVKAALQATGLAATRVELEITESVSLADDSINLAMLHELRALGVRISLDDFGMGYASVDHLRMFCFDKIKIDRSFVADVAENRAAAAIVRAIATLGTSLDMLVTAEGVETEEQLATVRELGCDEAQGYYLSTPRPASDVDAILRLERRFIVVPTEPCTRLSEASS
jgi:diguanylate cyclase (GGDEF)-like protein